MSNFSRINSQNITNLIGLYRINRTFSEFKDQTTHLLTTEAVPWPSRSSDSAPIARCWLASVFCRTPLVCLTCFPRMLSMLHRMQLVQQRTHSQPPGVAGSTLSKEGLRTSGRAGHCGAEDKRQHAWSEAFLEFNKGRAAVRQKPEFTGEHQTDAAAFL